MSGHRLDPSVILGVSKRCPWGFPQVLVCSPLKKDLKPFPTTFWLTCPWLGKVLGAIESKGGVRSLEEALGPFQGLWTKYHMAHGIIRLSLLSQSQRRFLRLHRRSLWDCLRLGGVGGMDYMASPAPRVKCLHLQVASWLSLGYHPGSFWLEDRIPVLSCPDCCCSDFQSNSSP